MCGTLSSSDFRSENQDAEQQSNMSKATQRVEPEFSLQIIWSENVILTAIFFLKISFVESQKYLPHLEQPAPVGLYLY